MTARGVNVSFRMKVKTTDTVDGFAKDRLGWARWPGRHGGEAPALCVGTDDVGLDSSISHQGEGTEKASRRHRSHATALASVGMTCLLAAYCSNDSCKDPKSLIVILS